MAKLNDGKVCGERSLFALFPDNSNTLSGPSNQIGKEREDTQLTNVGSLDHTNVVPSVPDTTYTLHGMSPDEPSDVGLLGWRTPARDHGGEACGDLDELVRE